MSILCDLMLLGGVAAVVYGVSQISPPWAWIAAGIMAVAGALRIGWNVSQQTDKSGDQEANE